MKKLMAVLVAVLALGLTACMKDYTCECVESDGSIYTFKFPDSKQNTAEEECGLLNKTYAADGGNCLLE